MNIAYLISTLSLLLPTGSLVYPDPVEVAEVMVAGFDSAQAAAASFPADHPDRFQWGRSPAPRSGVQIGDLSETQMRQLRLLLTTVLTRRAVDQVFAVVDEQGRIAEDGMGPEYYWLAFYGTPSHDGRWGWRLGGHHVSIHAFFEGRRLLGLTPLMLGTEYLTTEASALVGRRERLARSFLQTLTEAERGDAVVPARVDTLEINPGRHPRFSGGIRIDQLTAAQRTAFASLLREYLNAFRGSTLPAEPCLAGAANVPARFLWLGSPADGDAHYYRITGTGFSIEYVNHGRHMHSILRTAADFGRDPGDACDR